MNHNLNDPHHPWTRLNNAAREVRDDRDASAPFGFTTRIAALALAQEVKVASLFDLFALRAVGIASLLALGSVALNFHAITNTSSGPSTVVASLDDDMMPTTDAVAVVFDLAD